MRGISFMSRLTPPPMRLAPWLTLRGAGLFLAVAALAMGCRVKAPPKPVDIQQGRDAAYCRAGGLDGCVGHGLARH
jgi:hypothetical protein